MSPVIRMADEVFRRLQRISEPLIDTPSEVIDRILTYYENSVAIAKPPGIADAIRPQSDASERSFDRAVEPNPRLFIAPASDANLRRTILEKVDLASVETLLTDQQVEQITEVLGSSRQFHCWALTESRRFVFDAMRPSDVVVLITPQTAFVCKIQHKLISERLGNYLWPSQPRLPWKFVYLVTDVRELRVRKNLLNKSLGYKPSHVFPGVSRVRPDALRTALDEHGTIHQLLVACST